MPLIHSLYLLIAVVRTRKHYCAPHNWCVQHLSHTVFFAAVVVVVLLQVCSPLKRTTCARIAHPFQNARFAEFERRRWKKWRSLTKLNDNKKKLHDAHSETEYERERNWIAAIALLPYFFLHLIPNKIPGILFKRVNRRDGWKAIGFWWWCYCWCFTIRLIAIISLLFFCSRSFVGAKSKERRGWCTLILSAICLTGRTSVATEKRATIHNGVCVSLCVWICTAKDYTTLIRLHVYRSQAIINSYKIQIQSKCANTYTDRTI